jgi:hypothetical protein
MKTIPLTQGKFALVDDEDYDYLMQWKWCAHKNPSKYHDRFYAVRSTWGKKRKFIQMHSFIMKPPLGMVIDHIDHDGLNNQKSNMRICTAAQNNMNLIPRGRSKYLGVCYNIQNKPKASIWKNNKTIYLGMFETEEDAARAYDIKAKELHGEFANLNFKD